MLKLLVIILLNIRRNLQSAVSMSAAGTMLAGLMVLLVGSSVAADKTPSPFSMFATPNTSHHVSVNPPQSALVLSVFGTNKASKANKLDKNAQQPVKNDTSQKPTHDTKVAVVPDGGSQTTTSDSSNSGTSSKSTDQQQSTTTNNVSLGTLQKVCNGHNTTTYAVPSARLSLVTPMAVDGTVTWSWEVRYDQGTSQPSAAPIDITQKTQPVTAGASVIKFTASDSSLPLLNAPSNAKYGYKFRLHVTGPVDATSIWVSVSQNDTSACTTQQN